MIGYGVTIVPTARGPDIAEIARAVEERGLDRLWLPDHTHIPVSQQAAMPGGGELPEFYRHILETLTCLATAAAVTTRLRIGSGVLLPAQRDPLVTAKALATIDCQSGGRLTVGVGYGWNVEEMRDHGVDPAARRARTREHVLAMRHIWEDDVASFTGEYVSFGPSWSWPKPAQRPLPVLLGGAPTPTLIRHVAEYGQGWIPLGGRGLRDGVARVRDACAAAGRDPGMLEIVPFTTPEPDHAKVDALEQAGATEVAFNLPPEDGPAMHRVLDRLATFVADRRG